MHADTDWTNPPGRRIGCLAIIRDPRGLVLLENTIYRDYWQLLGGGAMADEIPADACAREVYEETGLNSKSGFKVGSLLVVDYVPRSKTHAEGLNFVFDGGIIPEDTPFTLPKPKGQDDVPEVLDTAWVGLPELSQHTNAYQVRRILAAIAVLSHPGAPRDLITGAPRQ